MKSFRFNEKYLSQIPAGRMMKDELTTAPNDECLMMSDELKNNSALIIHNSALAASAAFGEAAKEA